MQYFPFVEGRQNMEYSRSAKKKAVRRCYICLWGAGRQCQRNDLLQKRRSGDVILAFSGRQTMKRSRSAENNEARRCYT
jgi:hypothetical protein